MTFKNSNLLIRNVSYENSLYFNQEPLLDEHELKRPLMYPIYGNILRAFSMESIIKNLLFNEEHVIAFGSGARQPSSYPCNIIYVMKNIKTKSS